MKAKTGRGLRKMVIWLNRISAVTIAVSIVFMLASSVISPAEENRTYTYYKTPIERGQTAFEDTALFTQILEKELEDILPMLEMMNCKSSIKRIRDEYYLLFETGFEKITVVVDKKGSYRITSRIE